MSEYTEPHKAVLECTAEGYTWTIYDEDKNVIAVHEMRRAPSGFRGTAKASIFEDAMENWPDLLDAIEDISGMHVCGAL